MLNTTKRSPMLVLLGALLFACSSSKEDANATLPDTMAPSNLVAGLLGGGVHLTWRDNTSDEESFQIERKEGNGSFALLNSLPFNSALYHDSDVTLKRQYTYRVRAKQPMRFTAYSNEATITLAEAGMTGAGGANIGSGGLGNNSAVGGGGSSTSAGGQSNSGGADSAGGQPNSAGLGGQATAGSGGSTAEVSFRNDVAPLLVQSCGSTTSGCHNADQAVGRSMPQFGPCKVIWFSAVDAPVGATYTSGPNQGQATGCTDLDLYDRVTGLHSMLCDAPSWDQRVRYVVPGNLNDSYLYQVIAGDASMGDQCLNLGVPVRRMPLVDPQILPNGVALTADGIAKIRDWILQGAKNN